jgi:cytochrome c oxidase subunit 3
MVLGLTFFAGVIIIEWHSIPVIANAVLSLLGESGGGKLTASSSVVGGIFYMMTGMHAFHVFTGLILLFTVWNKGRKGIYSAEQHWGVEAAAVYWHFVDLVWIFYYPALYLIGKVL